MGSGDMAPSVPPQMGPGASLESQPKTAPKGCHQKHDIHKGNNMKQSKVARVGKKTCWPHPDVSTAWCFLFKESWQPYCGQGTSDTPALLHRSQSTPGIEGVSPQEPKGRISALNTPRQLLIAALMQTNRTTRFNMYKSLLQTLTGEHLDIVSDEQVYQPQAGWL